MNKICTSLEQSKKLIELGIDVNTADMVYLRAYLGEERDYILLIDSYPEEYTEKGDGSLIPVYDEHIPAWSLSALLELIPSVICLSNHEGKYNIRYANEFIIDQKLHDSYIDACYEVVVWLKENNKI